MGYRDGKPIKQSGGRMKTEVTGSESKNFIDNYPNKLDSNQ